MKPVKIAIVGPESTGKSWLSERLAAAYQTQWVKEAARKYLEEAERAYEPADLLKIALLQCEAEDKAIAESPPILFCDTTLLVIKIWSEVRYRVCDQWIIDEEALRTYDFFLLTAIDLPWEDDPLREHPHLREVLYKLYYKALTDKGVPFAVVSGIGEERLHTAIKLLSENGFPLSGK